MTTSTLPACCVVPQRAPLAQRLVQAASALVIAAFFGAFILPRLLSFVPQAQLTASFGALFLFGFVASLSTCLASTGAYMLSVASKRGKLRDLIALHAGRLIIFPFGGALLGALGSSLPGGGTWYGILGLALGTAFLMVGLQLLDVAPATFKLRLPERFRGLADKAVSHENRGVSFIAGVLTFVLPCGFTQAAQGLALGSGSALSGAMFLGAFALGTAPVLIGITAFGSGKMLEQRAFRLAAGALLVMFAIGQIDGSLTIFGSPITLASAAESVGGALRSSMSVPIAQAQEQVIDMTVAYGAFSPNRFILKRGVPVRWQVNGQDVSGCASTLIAPSIGISQSLKSGLNVIQFTPARSGTIPFSCGMGMIRGSFVVVD